MLDILAKIVGPSRAVSLYVLAKRFWVPVLLLIGFIAAVAIMFLTSDAERMEHVAYLEAEVIATTPLTTSNVGAGVFVDVRLPDGSALKLTETEGAIARNMTDRACLEQQRDTKTGEMEYRLRLPHRCGF